MNNQTKKIPAGKELIDAPSLLKKIGIKEKMYVADLGCGRRGYFSLQAAKLTGDQGLVYAVDIVKSALENVRSIANLFGISNIKTIWADLEVYQSTKIASNSIDLVILNNVLFQIKKEELAIKESVRILKNEGKILVTDWEKTKAPFGPPVENRSDPEKIKQYCLNQGLSLEDEFKAGPCHYGLVFIKNS